ncbi:hypothetical protein Bca52824_031753 [Brassica carinata]|uniref:Uncharacterized protein n=1 Tax=Brassica carinata TaxID=52824 RepID=A0A8X7SBS3_BRACI|nr:hypothetical protein Bca52824_031753 [Brassica carinata]
MLIGLVDRLEKMEEKVDHRLQQFEEKVDMLNNEVAASMKIGYVKAEADNMSVDESSSDDEEAAHRNSEPNPWTPIKVTTSNRPFGPFVRGPTSLNVGGRFAGGRCGGLG